MTDHPIRRLVDWHKGGRAVGICSVCSAHPAVLRAAAREAADCGSPLLIEATCNQVNQDGGYSGLTPSAFRDFATAVAKDCGVTADRLILGGDHLGPSPWRQEPAEQAMTKAEVLVDAYARAGYSKLHLDPTMSCGDDPVPLPDLEIARRTARLCRVAEAAWRESKPTGSPPVYVAGSEVPVPGGAVGAERLRVTPCSHVEITLEHLEEQFRAHDLDEAWSRVVAIVVQPGVEFSGDSIHAYDRGQAAALSRFIEGRSGLICEAHSTDYQQASALRALVEDHFAILKVGPWLTFAYREAVFALAAMESEWFRDKPETRSGLVDVLAREMDADPRYWAPYIQGEGGASRPDLRYSLSDRIRYYWNRPRVREAVDRLTANLSGIRIPMGLVSQYFPEFWDLGLPGSSGMISPALLVESRIRSVLDRYRSACGVFPG